MKDEKEKEPELEWEDVRDIGLEPDVFETQ